MTRREMLAAGFRQLARLLPVLNGKPDLTALVTGSSPIVPLPETASFPKNQPKPAYEGPSLVKED